jgi:hypothetical protein
MNGDRQPVRVLNTDKTDATACRMQKKTLIFVKARAAADFMRCCPRTGKSARLLRRDIRRLALYVLSACSSTDKYREAAGRHPKEVVTLTETCRTVARSDE